MTAAIWKTDPLFPPLLREIADPPARLFSQGMPLSSEDRYFAVVGTRNASPYGREMAAFFSAGLAKAGFVIVSGLAYGIDAIAHSSALENGGRTIAILGAGFDHITPTCNLGLAEEIKKNGALLTEYEKETPPYKGNFPARNRIIAGMSIATLVVEGPEKSGSLITARLAVEYNREVFTIPANITNANAQGTNRLIRDGLAYPVTCIEDIFTVLEIPLLIDSSLSANTTLPAPQKRSPVEKKIHDTLKKGSYTIDEHIAETSLGPAEISINLSKLELDGSIKNTGGAYRINNSTHKH